MEHKMTKDKLQKVLRMAKSINLLNESRKTLFTLCEKLEDAAMAAYDLECMELGEELENISEKAYSLAYNG